LHVLCLTITRILLSLPSEVLANSQRYESCSLAASGAVSKFQ
jgi:hypothetical protein